MFFSYVILLNTVVPISLYVRLALPFFEIYSNFQCGDNSLHPFDVDQLRPAHVLRQRGEECPRPGTHHHPQ